MMVTTFLPVSYEVEARRFRPGLDYVLATSDKETKLDVVLGLTPPPPTLDSAPAAGKKGKGKGKLKNVTTEDQDFWPLEWGGSDVSPFFPFSGDTHCAMRSVRSLLFSSLFLLVILCHLPEIVAYDRATRRATIPSPPLLPPHSSVRCPDRLIEFFLTLVT